MGGNCSKRATGTDEVPQVSSPAPSSEDPSQGSIEVNEKTIASPRPAAPKRPLEVPEAYTAEWMTVEELARVSVPFDDVKTALRPVLEEYGMAVVTDVIPTQTELKELEDMFHQDLLQLIDDEALASAPSDVRQAYERFRIEGPRALPVRTANDITAAAGFALERCLCHGQFAWTCRRHERVHAAFDAIFNEGPLVTSLDATFFTPAGAKRAKINDFSAHVDQNPHDARPHLASCEVYQGVLYIWPSVPGCSTTAAWPRSHRQVYPEMMKDNSFRDAGQIGFHYSQIDAMQDRQKAAELARGWQDEARLCTVPAGSLLLWNSRTVHTGWKSGARLAQAVCLQPAAQRPEQEQVSKMRLAALGLPSTHWSSHAMQHDMTLYSYGCFTGPDPPLKYSDGPVDHEDVRLPLKSSIRPLALREHADLDALTTMVEVDFRYTGMWIPTQGAKEILDSCVVDEFKRYL